MKKFLLGAAALLMMALPAHAWTGCYGGALGGYSSSVSELSLDDGPFNVATLDGLGANGPAFGAIVGCDYRMGKVVIGGFGDYLWHDQEIGLSIFNGAADITVGLENQWSVGGRVGYLVNEATLVYGLAAYTKGETTDLEVNGASVAALQDQTGWSVGAGLETHLGNNLYLAGEYRYTDFDKNTYPLGGNDSISSDTDVHSGLVSLKYKFGATPAAAAFAPLK